MFKFVNCLTKKKIFANLSILIRAETLINILTTKIKEIILLLQYSYPWLSHIRFELENFGAVLLQTNFSLAYKKFSLANDYTVYLFLFYN